MFRCKDRIGEGPISFNRAGKNIIDAKAERVLVGWGLDLMCGPSVKLLACYRGSPCVGRVPCVGLVWGWCGSEVGWLHAACLYLAHVYGSMRNGVWINVLCVLWCSVVCASGVSVRQTC